MAGEVDRLTVIERNDFERTCPGHIFEDGRCVVCQVPGEREPSESEVERLTRQLAGAVEITPERIARVQRAIFEGVPVVTWEFAEAVTRAAIGGQS